MLGITLFPSYLTPLMPGSRLSARQIGLTSVLDPQADAYILLLEHAHSELSLQMKGDLAFRRLRLENPEAPAAPSRKGSHTCLHSGLSLPFRSLS